MVLPDAPATIFEGEAELALVIGKKASNVKAADAMDYVFGIPALSTAGAGTAGTRLFRDEIARYLRPDRAVHGDQGRDPDPQKLQIRLSKNGALMQNFNTSYMAQRSRAASSG